MVNGKKLRRLMREHGLQPRRRRYVVTTDSDHGGPIYPDLARDLVPDRPTQLWVADLTHVAIEGGFVYLAAIRNRAPLEGCLHHSDRASQHASEAYRELLTAHGLTGSMSRRGNPYDNAKAESFMKTLKVEAVYSAAYESFEDVAADLPRFIDDILRLTPPAFSPGLPQPRAVRGSTRPADGQYRGLILSTPKGALQMRVRFGRRLIDSHRLISAENTARVAAAASRSTQSVNTSAYCSGKRCLQDAQTSTATTAATVSLSAR